MSLTLYRTSAFPNKNSGGNEAGVVLDATRIDDSQMLSIAKRVNFSETAFVFPSTKADYKLRYFSPTVEVPLCGHATIATFNLMRNLDMLDKTHYTIETNEGILDVYIEPTQVVMQLKKPKFLDIIDKATITKKLGIPEEDMIDAPIQVVTTGIKEIFMGVKSLDILHNLDLDIDAIKTLAQTVDATGLYIYTLETKEGNDAQGRNFIPMVGIAEESATGTASGALACYLNKYLLKDQTTFTFEQGYALYKPSLINAKINLTQDTVTDVYVGGTMRLIDKIVGFMPETEDA
ncbi:MAG: PhzF family phenazine biosynthesis protein [Bacillota bacterium]